MPSLRAQLFLLLLKNRHLLRGKWTPDTDEDWRNDLEAVRQKAQKSAKIMGRVPKGFSITPEKTVDMSMEWLSPPGARPAAQGAVLYFHGGGYVLGSAATHRAIVAKYLKGNTVPALVFDYRLAPEHPFPAALEDALSAYDHMLAQGIEPGKIVFAGDSAGGGLLLATLVALRERGTCLPAGGVALSPWTDLTCSGQSLEANAATCLSPKDSWRACSDHYTAGADASQPLVSPLHAELSGLPPLLIFAGDRETLLDDAIRFANKAQACGGSVSLKVGAGLCHCYPALAPLFPEAASAMDDIRTFIRDSIEA